MVSRGRRAIPLLLAVAGCASAGAPEGPDPLARELAGRIAGEPRNCVSGAAGAGLQILAPGIVASRAGDTLWVSRLGPACSRMRPTDVLIVEAHGDRSCRGDRVSAVEPGGLIPGPVCLLGDFVPYRRAG